MSLFSMFSYDSNWSTLPLLHTWCQRGEVHTVLHVYQHFQILSIKLSGSIVHALSICCHLASHLHVVREHFQTIFFLISVIMTLSSDSGAISKNVIKHLNDMMK